MEHEIDNVLVVKVGTSTLVETAETGQESLDSESFARIGKQLLELQQDGMSLVVVSSGAITAGMVATGMRERPNKSAEMPGLQRLASIGWRHVLNAWSDALPDNVIGELLLTKQELELPTERDEVVRTTYELVRHGNIPVANENDAITHAEIAFGDNDTLAAIFAAKLRQSKLFGNKVSLILLSDVHGVYEDPTDASTCIPKIEDVTNYRALAQDTDNSNGTGGMITKFDAATIATENGVEMYIANGRSENAIRNALAGVAGTHFIAKTD